MASHDISFSQQDRRRIKTGARMMIGVAHRMSQAAETEEETKLWETNEAYLLGVLRQIERVWLMEDIGGMK